MATDPTPEPSSSLKPPVQTGEIPESAAPENPDKLTPEEQLRRFEEELKHSDWGHQPN